MTQSRRFASYLASPTLALLLAACGGGSSTGTSVINQNPDETIMEAGAPALTGNTATDGLNRLNFRRQQMGLTALARNGQVTIAAQGHSTYQKVNDTITHTQIAGKQGFTGAELADRLATANYVFTSTNGYAFGEVIAASGNLSGAVNAEDLITAIYHRFVIFEPTFKEAGAGSAGLSATGYNFFTVDFTANGLNAGLGTGQLAVYPFANQQNVSTIFYSDQESPDPVPGQDAVGYPISVHADIDATVLTQRFTVNPRGGSALATRLLSHSGDPETPASSAAIVPLSVLAAATTYDVQFNGTVAGKAVSRNWSFTTR